MTIDVFSQHFGCIKDPRQSAKVSYPLFDVLFLTVCATIGGASGWEDIEDFGEAHFNWLREKGLFTSGLPVHDTIARLISRLDPAQFQQCFSKWMLAVSEQTNGQLIAVDGKVLRSSYTRDDRKSTIHMVSAFATANGVVMGQVKTDAKSNEITAIPELLNALELKGALVSIDAMGCQTDIAKTITNKEADYLLAVKGNQETLYKAVQAQLTSVLDDPIVCIEKGRGRKEARAYAVLPATELAEEFAHWPRLKTLGVAMGYRLAANGKESLEYRYYISSAELSKAQFADAVRGHWGIENSLHWVLDTSFSEDNCQIYRENAAELLAIIRHMALNLLRQETGKKASIRRKQNIAAMNTAYLEQVLSAGFSRNESKK